MRNHAIGSRVCSPNRTQPIPLLVTDPHRPYTLWFMTTSQGSGLRFVIWPRKGIVRTVLRGDEPRWTGDFDTVEEAEEWGYRLYGALSLDSPALTADDFAVASALSR